MKSKLKGRRFQDVTEIQEQILTILHAIPKTPAVLPAVTETLDPLHELGRGQQRIIPKVGAYFVINSVRKRLDTPRTVFTQT
jgi:hypothetical protein